jgi:hypothetical protein
MKECDNSTRKIHVRSNFILSVSLILYIVCFVSFSVLFVCKCVLYYCHRVTTRWQLTNISNSVLDASAVSLLAAQANFVLGAPLRRIHT